MGCAQSDLTPPKEGVVKKSIKHKSQVDRNQSSAPAAERAVNNPLAGGAAVPATKQSAGDDSQHMLGKQKYIVDVGAMAMEDKRNGVVCGTLLLFSPLDYSGVVFSYRDHRTGAVYAREFTDANLVKERDSAGITLGWANFFKSIASDVMKSKATVASVSQRIDVTMTIVSSKDPKVSHPFVVRLDLKGKSGLMAAPKDLFRYCLEPMTRMVQRRRESTVEKEKELRYAKAECDRIVQEAMMVKHKAAIERLNPVIRPLRETCTASSKNSMELQNKVSQLDRKLRRLKQNKDNKLIPLDGLYDEGGARHFQHLPCADEHYPRELDLNTTLMDALRATLPFKEGEHFPTSIVRAPSTPQLQRMLEQCPGNMIENFFSTLGKLDQWDYNVFEADRSTGNNALFYTTYAILYKLDLVNYFNIDDQVLRNFLGALQSGYHPNPYHNATHAADVTQINYFIITTGGLAERCQLSKEDLLGAMIAGAIHDYDHPGFNNNFHTRTNAYLSTLYNDRSILENHHCACVSEILKLPKYNIFASLSDDQRRGARETMLEMVLATDMGNHAKIFSAFKRRVADGAKWFDRREDLHLALSMSIKMADISNCGRPQHLYLEWAKNIATEFYNQGDAEERRGLSISPFMDRRKDKTDFPKGQTSFMSFVVVPMFEALAEFLPPVEVALQHCHENKEYWQNQ